jgi:hypothetical protein
MGKGAAITTGHCLESVEDIALANGLYGRVPKEETSGQENHDRRRHVDRSIARILETATPAEGRVASEILVVSTQLSSHNVFGDFLSC